MVSGVEDGGRDELFCVTLSCPLFQVSEQGDRSAATAKGLPPVLAGPRGGRGADNFQQERDQATSTAPR